MVETSLRLRRREWQEDALGLAVLVIHHGDCVEVMSRMDAESVDAIVTDPPYALTDTKRRGGPAQKSYPYGQPRSVAERGFMGKTWDTGTVAFDPATWTEALRLLKPGGHLLAFGGTRTFHRLTCAIEDAGFEIRDCLSWLYGSGFPKSLDVSKAIDKVAGAQREDAGPNTAHHGGGTNHVYAQDEWTRKNFAAKTRLTSPATPDAEQWQGWGTALKPAWEPIVMARKPLRGTVAANVLEHGTGAINVDASRIAVEDADYARNASGDRATIGNRKRQTDYRLTAGAASDVGRWPANVVLDETTAELVDEASGELHSGFMAAGTVREGLGYHGGLGDQVRNATRGDTGGASRFFYTAKADSEERSRGMGNRNSHPTVKPVSLMSWLVRMVCPPGGTVLDPFLGSGTTAIAAIGCGFNWIGIEREAEYVEIARQRIGLFAA